MGLIFFFSIVLFYFEVATFSSIALRVCLPVHLDCHSLWPPGLSGASRRLAALLREYRGAREAEAEPKVAVGRQEA